MPQNDFPDVYHPHDEDYNHVEGIPTRKLTDFIQDPNLLRDITGFNKPNNTEKDVYSIIDSLNQKADTKPREGVYDVVHFPVSYRGEVGMQVMDIRVKLFENGGIAFAASKE